jgi:hypothetical protein
MQEITAVAVFIIIRFNAKHFFKKEKRGEKDDVRKNKSRG